IGSFRAQHPDAEIGEQEGAAFAMARAPLMGPSGAPCSPPPWGEVVAVDLGSGEVKWRTPLGRVPALAGVPGHEAWGSIGIGGPIVTAGGLVFAAASMDPAIRAYDLETGEELWTGTLPASGQATPMTYGGPRSGRQFVVIAAGGHVRLGTPTSDALVAFALPER
ncbi:MAG: PQQ-binding-like beta-propeller repeat protein, partial [Longimicrobiales bacterium]